MRTHRFAFAALVALFVPSAHAQIMQPGTQPTGTAGGLVDPIQTSGGCARCHGGYDDAGDYEPSDTWRGALMASAGRDPIFRAGLSIAEADNPAAADFCVRCHSPVAWLAGRAQVPAWSMDTGPRFAPDEPDYMSNDLDGVACMVCHRATDDVPSDPDAPHLSNAQIHYLDGAESETRLGPYAYEGEPPRHPARQSAFHGRGDFCGQCHDIDNPVVMGHRADGTETGRIMAIERTFSEWRSSALATDGVTCQDCHMPRIEGDGMAANEGTPRAGVRRHDLVGGSAWVLRAMASIYDVPPDVIAAWMRSADLAEQMLASAATVEVRSAVAMPGELAVTVRVTNETGHKLPTGYPEGRRMWLQLEVLNDAGDVLAGSGLYDEDEMRLVEDEQARTYEVKLGQGGTPSFHFVLNDGLLEDTRIPPRGFSPDPSRDMDPVGRDYGDGAGGYRNFDEVTYRFALCATGTLRVRARLRYQSTTREYIEFLRDTAPDDPDPMIDNWGAIAYDAWAAHGGGTPFDMTEATAMVEGECGAPMPDAGPPAGDAGVVPDSGIPGSDSGRLDSGTPGGGGDDGGCGCAIPGRQRTRAGALAPWAVALVAVLWTRRRRSHRGIRRDGGVR